MKLIRSIALGIAFVGISLQSALGVTIGLKASASLQGYDLSGGNYATLLDVVSTSSLAGQTITAADLTGTIMSGAVSGWYYAAGSPGSAQFNNISAFSPFVSDVVVTGGGSDTSMVGALWAVHVIPVAFKKESGRGTYGIDTDTVTNRITGQNPFASSSSSVPDAGATLLLALMGLAGLIAFKRR